MKKNLFLAMIAIFVAACSNEPEIDNQVDNNALVPVRVHVDGFNVSQEDFSPTRAPQNLTEGSVVNAVTLAFYRGTTEVYKSTQAKTDADFGTFSLSLPMGSYTMVAVAYYNSDASPLELSSPTVAAYTGVRAYETFAYTQAVNITNTNAVDVSATLDRVVSQLKVVSTDGKTADVSNVRMTLSAGSKSFDPSTGLAPSNTGIVNTVGVSASVGATSESATFVFLTADEQTMDVTIETLDSDGNTLFSKTVTNVPFKRNRRTKLTGAMYTNTDLSGTFQVETAWLTEENVAF